MTGLEIRRRRRALSLSQRGLGIRFGVRWETVSRWERGALTPAAPEMLNLAFRWLESEAARPASSR